MAKAFEMDVIFAQLPSRPLRDNQIELATAVPQADFISLHCPLSPETEQLVNQSFLEKMKSTAYLINTARGPLIDEFALAAALANNQIAGAALDVLSQEPPPKDNPLLMNQVDNLVLTPHNAWASQEAKKRLIEKMALNIEKFLAIS